ncbi:ATP-dependent RNA helicase pitchoune [Handroanthus impetiginosus]|uniref:ATP-dependent RNA helicase n=1 Tax=Handroanthus impetiginosus TaxID=429701 RepID=A0A2G9I9U7_9LAMI|nr:ATP-dependent RNA helicase pitchoune [Handroanthus impetiginosus]
MPSTLSPFRPILRPIISGFFPHKLKYQFLAAQNLQRRLLLNRGQAYGLVPIGTSKYSTRSGRERMQSGTNVRAGSSKSLIEDEAELSDWVSGLNSNSFKKTRLYSDSDNDGDDMENGRFSGREGAGKRRRESEPDKGGGRRNVRDFEFPRKRGGARASREPFSGRMKNGNDSNDSLFGGGKGRGRDLSEHRRGEKFGGLSEEKRESKSGFLRRGNGESRGKRQSERGFEMGYRNGRNRDGDQGGFAMKREGKGMEKSGFVITDDEDMEEDDKKYKSFKQLIDSDEDEDEEEEGEEVGADGQLEKESFDSRVPRRSPQESDSYLSESRFDQCSISTLSLKGIKDAGYEKMTLVQEATLPVILKGKDVLAKAKTGTGKTVAFLLPAIEIVLKSTPIARDQKRPPILVLIICPTRELASQAAAEANALLKYHPSIGVQVVIGGTRLALEQKRMQANPCQILVATPGRLRDHIENTAGFATRLMGVKVLVLDEADHLLGMGFRKEIEKIIAAVPKQRQTLLFSATIPEEVRQICHVALKRDHEFINTVQEGSEDTHAKVRQMHLVAPLDEHFPLLYTLLKEHVADDVNYKILVFCTTAMVTKLVAELLGELNLNVREIHSRKSQSYRTKVSDEFRKSKGLILVTSDVSARGVDYPDVTLVLQIGIPADRQQYIHRLGRTGRKGKEGQGILMLAPWEEVFLSSVKDLPISKAPKPLVDPDTRKKVERALSHVQMKSKEAAYQAWLGYYNGKNVGRDKYVLVERANEFSRTMGLDNPPAIPKLVLGKMGLRNIPGLRSK